MEIFRSAAQLFWGVIRRFWLWWPALLLDPFDLYAVVKPYLPASLQTEIEMPSDWGLIALVGLLIWAVVLTYHEVRSKNLSSLRPDTRIREAINYLTRQSKWGYRKYRHEKRGRQMIAAAAAQLRQAAADGDITIWGKELIVDDPPRYSALERPIPPEYWKKYKLEDRDKPDDGFPRPETVLEDQRFADANEQVHFRYLRVNLAEIRRYWKRSSRRQQRKMHAEIMERIEDRSSVSVTD